MSNTKNNVAWKQLFEKHNILSKVIFNGFYEITATEINEFREARLMTKFDHKSQLPPIFHKNNLSILPISRGSYVIGQFETFCKFNKSEIEILKVNFPHNLESLDFRNITSEATAINCSYVSNILMEFTEEEELFPTVSGRMSSSTFNFGINSNKGVFNVSVVNSQVEIDGGYEGENSLSLIEAKNYISDDFLVRQLYYPYKLWNEKINKKVRPIFLTYTNGVFHLREYEFENSELYNSIILKRERKYSIQEGIINNELIEKLINSTKIVKEPDIPFPQADSFERVINLCELLKEKVYLTKDDITLNYDFESRQSNYYADAGRYLGLIKKYGLVFSLTKLGDLILEKPIFERKIEFIKLILSHSAFKKTLQTYFTKGNIPSTEEVIEIMKSCKLYNVNEYSTYKRRASTVRSWVNWIVEQNEE
jgi:hypothetical protein